MFCHMFTDYNGFEVVMWLTKLVGGSTISCHHGRNFVV